MFFVVAGAEVFAQLDNVREALNDAVHVARVPEIFQSSQTRSNDSVFGSKISLRYHGWIDQRRKRRLHWSINHRLLWFGWYFIFLNLIGEKLTDSSRMDKRNRHLPSTIASFPFPEQSSIAHSLRSFVFLPIPVIVAHAPFRVFAASPFYRYWEFRRRLSSQVPLPIPHVELSTP